MADLDGDLRGLRTIARWARALMVIYLAAIVTMVVVVVLAAVDLRYGGLQTANSRWTFAALEATSTGIGIITLVLTPVVPVLVLIWIHRAHAMLHALRLEGLNYSPGWAVGSFFVPLVNLIVPFRAMRELCNRSFGESEYQAREPVGDVSSWWTCGTAGGAILLFLLLMALIEAATPVWFTTPGWANLLLGLFCVVLMLGSGVFLFRIIGSVTRAQASGVSVGNAFA